MIRIALPIILTLLPALCGASPVVDCPSPNAEPCRPNEQTKRDLLTRIGAVIQKKSEVLQTFSDWQSARGGTDKKLELVRFEAYMKARRELGGAASQAMEEIEDDYNVAPAQRAGRPRKPAGRSTGLDWVEKIDAHWKPTIGFDDDDIRSVEVDGSRHYLAASLLSEGGNTYPDGEVVIPYQTFLDAYVSKSPGIVASILYHEGLHFSRLISGGWTNHEHEEALAYSAAVSHLDAFDLPQEWIDVNTSALASNQNAENSGQKTGYSISPAEEKAIKGSVDTQEAAETDLGAYYQKLKADVQTAAAEQARRQADRDAAAARTAKVTTAEAVAQCGFEPVREPSGGMLRFLGFKSTDANGLHLYNFPSAKTMDELKVILMLARTCAAVTTGRTDHVDAPCNAGIDILNQHQNDSAFLGSVAAQVTVRSPISDSDLPDQTYAYPCVADKLALIRFPLDANQYKGLFQREAEINGRLNKTELIDESRNVEHWRSEEASSREPATVGRRSDATPTKHCAASRGGVCVWWSN